MTLTREEWQAVINTMESAPLQNMQHAQAVRALCEKVLAHAEDQLCPVAKSHKPEPQEG